VTGPRCSASFAIVAAEHDGSLDVVRQRGCRLIAEHGLEHGEDALGRRRGGREGEDDPRCIGPRRKLNAVDLPSVEHTLGEGVLYLDSELLVKTVVLVAHRVPSQPSRPSDDKLRLPKKARSFCLWVENF
jgi:hypothetical protein